MWEEDPESFGAYERENKDKPANAPHLQTWHSVWHPLSLAAKMMLSYQASMFVLVTVCGEFCCVVYQKYGYDLRGSCFFVDGEEQDYFVMFSNFHQVVHGK